MNNLKDELVLLIDRNDIQVCKLTTCEDDSLVVNGEIYTLNDSPCGTQADILCDVESNKCVGISYSILEKHQVEISNWVKTIKSPQLQLIHSNGQLRLIVQWSESPFDHIDIAALDVSWFFPVTSSTELQTGIAISIDDVSEYLEITPYSLKF